MIKCTKTYTNLVISFLNEIANGICLAVFIVFLAIAKIVIHIVVTCTIIHRKLHHRQTTRTDNTTSTISLEEEEGGGGVRLSLNDIHNLSSFEYEAVVESTNQDCIVCLERFIKGETCRSLPRCKHVFHASCVDSWLIQVPSCPLCRRIVVKPGVNHHPPPPPPPSSSLKEKQYRRHHLFQSYRRGISIKWLTRKGLVLGFARFNFGKEQPPQ
ncbi:hypothetical protein C5167_007465 [Papaver somniferum]|nr:hypothetical protein C5167_007465 [Papaver somniferum]